MRCTKSTRTLGTFSMLAIASTLGACRNESPRAAAAAQPAAIAGVIDSAIPIAVALDRFRRDLSNPERLRSDISSRDALVQRVVVAMSKPDTTTLEQLALNRAEYAWLYYPSTTMSKPPYELPPALAWFQLQEKNRKGALRALRELGGHTVVLRHYRCDPNATVEGDNRIWTGCIVTIVRDAAASVSLRLFGAIIERGGRFEVLSYENDF